MTLKFSFHLVVSLFFILNPSSDLWSDYVKPFGVSENVWKDVEPYLLPENHPIKKKLDKLFTSFRVTENAQSIERAGFKRSKPAFFSHAIISENIYIKDYFFKFYSDEQFIEIESKQWIDRAFESRSLRKAIHEYGYEKYFIVPKKWIYPIPDSPESKGPYPKHFILVAEKIKILKSAQSKEKWKYAVTKKLLKAVFTLVQKEGLIDSTVAHNLPFTKKNKLVFVDLEQHHQWPVPFHRLLNYLNEEMQSYWISLIDKSAS